MGTSFRGVWEHSIPSRSANEAKTPRGMHWIQLGSSKNILEQSETVLVSLALKPRLEQAKKPVKRRKEPLVPAPHSCILSDHGRGRGQEILRILCHSTGQVKAAGHH